MRRYITLVLVISLSFASTPPSKAVEAPVRHFLMSCTNTPLIECIKSITAISPNGFKSKATKPLRSVQVIGGLNPIDTREEWEFPGFTFEGTAGNKAVPGIVYRPKGSEDCDAARCITGLEEIQIGMGASWLNATPEEWGKLTVDLTRRGNQYLCGTAKAPTKCSRNHNFNGDVSFEIVLRMPSDFEPAALLGSVKNLSFTKGSTTEIIDGISYRELSVRFDPQVIQRPLFSELVPDPMGTSQYADFVSDASNFWIVGSKSIQVSTLGKCAGIPFLTILSNSIYQDLPIWNPSTQSIDVSLTAPHFNVGGSIQKGYFEATISKAMGLCLWGVDLSKKSVAKISITYSGESGQEVQTLSGRYDGENYILFSANFHYSSPKISLRMQSAQAIQPENIKPNVKSVKCVKGKVIKVIKGPSQKCPAGYKVR